MVEVFSDQKNARLQNNRAGGVPGRVVLKKKDTPLAPPVTFLKSTDKLSEASCQNKSIIYTRKETLADFSCNTGSQRTSGTQPPFLAWVWNPRQTQNCSLIALKQSILQMTCNSEGIAPCVTGSNPPLSSCVVWTCYFSGPWFPHLANGPTVLSLEEIRARGSTGVKLRTVATRQKCYCLFLNTC